MGGVGINNLEVSIHAGIYECTVLESKGDADQSTIVIVIAPGITREGTPGPARARAWRRGAGAP